MQKKYTVNALQYDYASALLLTKSVLSSYQKKKDVSSKYRLSHLPASHTYPLFVALLRTLTLLLFDHERALIIYEKKRVPRQGPSIFTILRAASSALYSLSLVHLTLSFISPNFFSTLLVNVLARSFVTPSADSHTSLTNSATPSSHQYKPSASWRLY